jgi:transcriptional regulator with XRE-family HTH domain
MDLIAVRTQAARTLKNRRMTQEAFARKHNLSSSWFNKFLRGCVTNPRINSLERVQRALENEARTDN